MDGAALAIRGHASAHSLATGPLIAEPFISPLMFTITPALSKIGGERLLSQWHFAKLTLKVEHAPVFPPELLSLSNNDRRHDFLTKLWLTLLDCGYEHIANASSRQSVQSSANAINGNDVKVLGTSVVGAVHNCRNRKTKSDLEFVNTSTSGTTF